MQFLSSCCSVCNCCFIMLLLYLLDKEITYMYIMMVVFRMLEIVPSIRYSSVCNVLRH